MAVHPSIADIRKVYQKKKLNKRDVDLNPIEQFKKWWEEAVAANADEVNAMTLATCDPDGHPSARIVLLKGIHDDGFIFFTNYTSRKADEIKKNPRVALLFFWKELERQVRIEGKIGKITTAESAEYFHSRPVESQVGAWTSPQSKVIPSRDFLEAKQKEIEKEFQGKEIPLPSFWGGYIVHPSKIEFWQGRPGRLHDRILYTLDQFAWKTERLAP